MLYHTRRRKCLITEHLKTGTVETSRISFRDWTVDRPSISMEGVGGHHEHHNKQNGDKEESKVGLQFTSTIDDYAKDGGEELFTEMHCVLITNP